MQGVKKKKEEQLWIKVDIIIHNIQASSGS